MLGVVMLIIKQSRQDAFNMPLIGEILRNRNEWDFAAPFQRDSVWFVEQKLKLWDAILDGDLIPSFVFNSSSQTAKQYTIIDGKQRLEAILDFIDGKILVRGESWDEQNSDFKFEITSMLFQCIQTRFDTYEEMANTYLNRLILGREHMPGELQRAVNITRRNH